MVARIADGERLEARFERYPASNALPDDDELVRLRHEMR
jgi:hypothetical protein